MSPEHELSTTHWHKSSYSNDEGANCVEVADHIPGVVPVRDSKVPTGPVLMLTPTAWTEFVAFTASSKRHA